MMFTASDKEQMLSGKTQDRLYEMPNPHTGEKEWCYVTLNPATNRFVTVPRREVPELRFFVCRSRGARCATATSPIRGRSASMP